MQAQKLSTGRREFLKRSAGGIVSASTLSLFAAHAAWAQAHNQGVDPNANASRGYGPLARTPDQNGEMILALPAGFSYVTFSKTGAPLLSGGGNVARNHDGMTALPGPDGTVRLIRNHEVRNAPGDDTLGILGPSGTRYDPLGRGGTITVDFDAAAMAPVREFISLNGTIVNCAGGLAFRDVGWITCEETTAGPNQGWSRKHGYNFLVPASAMGSVMAVPLTAMGRFSHEASVADPRTGIVYQTEDAGNNSGFYRFLPNDAQDLAQGGRLQMLKVSDQPAFTGWMGQTVGRLLTSKPASAVKTEPASAPNTASCAAVNIWRYRGHLHDPRYRWQIRTDDRRSTRGKVTPIPPALLRAEVSGGDEIHCCSSGCSLTTECCRLTATNSLHPQSAFSGTSI